MKGVTKFLWLGARFLSDNEKKVDKAVARLAFRAQRKVKILISKKWPPPSRAGEPPHYRTRQLLNSIMAERVDARHWRVGSPLDYALYLEFGYAGGGWNYRELEPRPFLRPVMRMIKAEAADVFVSEVKSG